MKTLKRLFLSELADRYDAEKRLLLVMPRMAKAATCAYLQKFIRSHLKETESHVKKLEKVFQAFGEKVKVKKCPVTVGLVLEGNEIAFKNKGSPAINAALICVAQKLEYYEIASYGCLREWAEMLGNKKAASLLKGMLEEEKAANRALIELARSRSNQDALGGCAEAVSRCDINHGKLLRRLRSTGLPDARSSRLVSRPVRLSGTGRSRPILSTR